MIDENFSIIVEPVYIDKLFRDSYYYFYSEKSNEISRNCVRLSLFKNKDKKANLEDFYCNDSLFRDDNFIGVIVLRPLSSFPISRAFLNPQLLNFKIENPFYLLHTNAEITILGRRFKIDGFPFSSQDGEYLRCAEISLWSIFEYYGKRYSNYRTVLPHEFLNHIDKFNPERILPSKGMNYLEKSKILKQFGFYPVVYHFENIGRFNRCRKYKNIFHLYVESGIPISMSLISMNKRISHATVCIGHGIISYDDEDKIKYDIKNTNDDYTITFVDSSELINDYVIMDDNSIPYRLDRFNLFSTYVLPLKQFIVPLHKKVHIEAVQVYEWFNILTKRFIKVINDYLTSSSVSDPIVVRRIFLTNSDKYRTYRVENSKSNIEKQFYGNITFSEFIWVMEMSELKSYKNHNQNNGDYSVFGEFIIDAASNSLNLDDSVISVRIGNNVGYRFFSESFLDSDENVKSNIDDINRSNVTYMKCFKGINDFPTEFAEFSHNLYMVNNLHT